MRCHRGCAGAEVEAEGLHDATLATRRDREAVTFGSMDRESHSSREGVAGSAPPWRGPLRRRAGPSASRTASTRLPPPRSFGDRSGRRCGLRGRADNAVEADVLAAFAAADAMGAHRSSRTPDAGPKSRVDELTSSGRADPGRQGGRHIVCCREAVRRFSTLRGGSGGSIVLVARPPARLCGSGEYVDYAASRAPSTRSASGSPGRWRPKGSGSTSCGPA